MTDAKETREAPAIQARTFRDFYEEELEPVLDEHEKRRRASLLAAGCMIAVLAIAIVFILYAIRFSDYRFPTLIIAFGVIFATTIVHWCSCGFREKFKCDVVSRIARFVNPELAYDHTRGIPQPVFDSARLFKKPNRYRTEDLFYGLIGETKIEFAEISAKRQTGYGKNKTVKVLFSGVFFVADFNKNFTGNMVVVPDKAEAALGWVGQKLQEMNVFRAGDLVALEDAEFEKLFAVYATDQQQARYILTPAFMRRMVDFRKRTDSKYHLAFINSKMYLAFPADDKWEPNVYSSIKCHSLYEEFYNDIAFFVNLVDHFNLNLRIWGKMPES